MPHNRISGWPVLQPEAPFVSCRGFMACPAVVRGEVTEDQRALQEQIYHWAMEQASAVVRPSITQRWQANLLN